MKMYRDPEWSVTDPERVGTLRSAGHLFWQDTLALGLSGARLTPPQELGSRLLGHGGLCALLQPADPDVAKLLDRGEAFPATQARRVPGARSRCHGNAARLWWGNRDKVGLCTGYALSDDGIWRQHSWCLDLSDPRRAHVVETTTPRVRYYGYLLNEREAEEFYEDNQL